MQPPCPASSDAPEAKLLLWGVETSSLQNEINNREEEIRTETSQTWIWDVRAAHPHIPTWFQEHPASFVPGEV